MEKTFTITAAEGLHARPCTLLVQGVAPFQSNVTIAYNGREANLKSIMGVMALAIPSGGAITVRAEGDDAAAALAKVEEVIKTQGIGQ
ncbi:HPr family phosphocarrier protein [Metasolibacillus sp. FSL H7-0170]|uniref:HPr family phosphocarrier protein n=1 Tax=Metasolibacillus TaxID=2703677 RepID=UPI0007958DAF|nr:phosphocarrier protein HPr [[Bacillus] sp. KCTC 13219]